MSCSEAACLGERNNEVRNAEVELGVPLGAELRVEAAVNRARGGEGCRVYTEVVGGEELRILSRYEEEWLWKSRICEEIVAKFQKSIGAEVEGTAPNGQLGVAGS